MEYIVKGKKYVVISKLGHGKGGYSFLVECEGKQYVLKKIHHEPCSYYTFSNKIQSEYDAYKYLSSLNLPLPMMYEIDFEQEIVIKEYIEGETIYDLVLHEEMKKEYIDQMKEMCKVLYENNTNIDYFPTNFVVKNNIETKKIDGKSTPITLGEKTTLNIGLSSVLMVENIKHILNH